jgi:hypothetical protein
LAPAAGRCGLSNALVIDQSRVAKRERGIAAADWGVTMTIDAKGYGER